MLNQRVKTGEGENCMSPHYQFMYSQLPGWCYKQVASHVVAFLFSHTLEHILLP